MKQTSKPVKRKANISKKTKQPEKDSLGSLLPILKKTLLVTGVILLISTFVLPIANFHQKNVEAVTPKTAVIYGDSLTYESMWEINAQFKTKAGWTNYIHAFPGTAPCDWLTWLPQDLATWHPNTVSISTAGNFGTPCMKDANGVSLPLGSQAYYARYTADLDSFFAQVTATGARVVFMKAPPMPLTAHNDAINQITAIATQLAGKYHGVSVSSVPRTAVSTNNKYVTYKPCLGVETAAMGCGADGKIRIRSLENGNPGIHFCPGGLPSISPYQCLTYSSGEFRWGRSIANTTVSPPAPILP